MNDLSSIDHTFIRKLTEIIQTNLGNENFGVKELARETGMSRFNLNRKLHSICYKTINQFIREVRLERAMEMLLKESVTASEVAYKVGFSSPAYFSTCFSEYFGYPPGEVKKRALNSPEENGKGFVVEPVSTKQEPVQTGIKQPGLSKQVRWVIVVASFCFLFFTGIIYYFNPKIFGNLNFSTNDRIKTKARSIAVLPFINDSKDQENMYFINGVLEAILDNLAKIKDLEVRPRTSVEQYRNNGTKTIPQIAHELGVNFIIEGSGQKIGDQVSLYIQLIEASTDKHLFSIRKNMKLEDIFNLQSEVAFKVASEIKAVITVEEKELIEKPPTTNIAAWEMYSRGFELHNIADLENNIENDKHAKEYFKKAIQLDSTYAEPYVQLGWICCYYDELDSAFSYANKALHFDDKNSNAHCLRGFVFYVSHKNTKAEEAFNLAIQYNPNCSFAFDFLADMYYNQGDSYKAIKNKLKVLKLENNPIEKRYNLISLWDSFNNVGLYEEGKKYAEKLIALTGDSTYFYWTLLQLNYNLGKSESVVNYAHKIYNADSLNLGKLLGFHNSYFLGNTYVNLRNYKEAYRILEKYTASMNQQGRKIQPYHYFGYIYLQNGRKKEADFHSEGFIKEILQLMEQNKTTKKAPPNLGLTFGYAAIGKKAKALEHLRVVNSCAPSLYTCTQITVFKISPMIDCIRNEPEYEEFLKNAEIRYQEEHDKVEKLLSDEGILISSQK
ncbi:MAG: helix-turn-helix domain-containing protein [Bacteroidia bacterium]|nr:helix-turn-helix domain-containing protein [Bacteroidia bacterium]